MPQLVPEDWAPQLIWLAITFGLLYVLMVYVALPRIGKVIETRAAHIAADLAAADKLRRETEEAIANLQRAISQPFRPPIAFAFIVQIADADGDGFSDVTVLLGLNVATPRGRGVQMFRLIFNGMSPGGSLVHPPEQLGTF